MYMQDCYNLLQSFFQSRIEYLGSLILNSIEFILMQVYTSTRFETEQL